MVEMRPSCGESDERCRQFLSVSWVNGDERWGQKVGFETGKGWEEVNREALLPVISSLIFLQLAESDFASTFRLLTVFAYGTYADYLGNQRAGALE